MYRTTLDTRRLGAVETAVCLLDSHLFREAFVHFFRASRSAINGVEPPASVHA